jgi:L-threonylcarbamoyladenylate synthase
MSKKKFLPYLSGFIYKRENSMNKIYQWNQCGSYQIAQKILMQGQVVLADSDTVLGLLARCTAEGYALLDRIKNRSDKPYIILVGSLDQVWEYANKSIQSEILRLVSYWPAPLTLIFEKREDSPHYIPHPYKKVALRIPNHAPLRQLALEFGGLFSTSANKTGKPTPHTIAEVDSDIIAQVGCIIQNEQSGMQPSTILDCTTDPVTLIREGAYPIEKLEHIYGRSFIQ